MKTIEKKVWPEYFQQILDGNKTFELRLNDFDIENGDTFILREWDPEIKDYTGRVLEKKIGYVGKWKIEDLKFWSQEEIKDKGIQIISLI